MNVFYEKLESKQKRVVNAFKNLSQAPCQNLRGQKLFHASRTFRLEEHLFLCRSFGIFEEKFSPV
jgi:hypothetical protein